jgi:GR25 family glycosyltransferase involved in LPS biosynthesis
MQGFYINLAARTDRRTHFEQNIQTIDFFKGIKRFPAIEHTDGPIGCGLSHLNALKQCLLDIHNTNSNTNKYICIFEDDFMVLNMENMQRFITDFKHIESNDIWDVIVLTPRGNTVVSNKQLFEQGFKKIIDNQTATGYIIKTRFAPILIQNLEEAIQNMANGKNKDMYAIDQYWKQLQKTHEFYYYTHIFGGQLPGWSNNENRYVDYNARFINQYLY